MYISPIANNNSNLTKYKLNKDIIPREKINFYGLTPSTNVVGHLKNETANKISNLLHAYNDIASKLACKTEEGIKYIVENFPVTIRDCIIFHNCGENNNSIAINLGGNSGAKNLTHIVRRRGNSTWSERIVEEAYMIENNSRLLSEFKTNYMDIFPQERKYLTQKDLETSQADDNLQKLIDDLEPVMLKFRIFLSKNMNMHLRIPDGKIPYSIIEEIKKTERLIDASREDVKKIPKKQLYKLLEEQHKEYVPLKGNSTYSFKNLGEEKLTIAFAPIDSQIHKDLKRLVVYNEDGSLKKVFIMQGNKLVKNTSADNPTYLADKFIFYDEKEILKDEVTGEFLKYLKMYQKSVIKLQAIVSQRAKSIKAKTIEGFFNDETTNHFKNAEVLFNEILEIYAKAPSTLKKHIKEALALKNIKFSASGITMPAKEKFKEIYYQPVKSNIHSDLLKFAITDKAAETLDYYLIHNKSQIVKNFWVNSPHIIPQKIKYLEEEQMPDLKLISRDTESLLAEIKETMANIIKNNYEQRLKAKEEAKLVKVTRKEKVMKKPEKFKSISKEEYNEFIKSCKKQFNDALKELDGGLENFDINIKEIRKKVIDFYIKSTTRNEVHQ